MKTSKPDRNTRIIDALKEKTKRIALTLEKFLGKPKQQLRSGDPLDVLIGTILSQNTNDRNSHRAYTNLRAAYPAWEDALRAPVKELADYIRTGGMAESKARWIQKLLGELKAARKTLSMEYLRTTPTEEIFAELTRYDGVGMKTTSCVCLFALGRDVFPVDTHVHRVCNRLGLVKTKTPDKTFEAMKPLVPKGKAYSLHTNLIRFGRRVCKAQNPQCGACPLFEECAWRDKKKYASAATVGGAKLDFMLMDAL